MASAQRKTTDAEAMEQQRVTELRGMQSRCESAEVAEELAEAKAQKMREKLMTEMAAKELPKDGRGSPCRA